MKFCQLNEFHDRILGGTPEDERFQATPRKRELYRAYASEDKRGFAYKERDEELLIATLVLGLRQTQFRGEKELHPVILAVPKALDAWANEVSKAFYKAVMKQFRKDVAMSRTVRKSFEVLLWEYRVLHIPEPTRWVAYGFDYSFPVASWMEGRLIVPKR